MNGSGLVVEYDNWGSSLGRQNGRQWSSGRV